MKIVKAAKAPTHPSPCVVAAEHRKRQRQRQQRPRSAARDSARLNFEDEFHHDIKIRFAMLIAVSVTI